MSNLSRPPYGDKDFSGRAWQKWFSSVQELLAPIASGGLFPWSAISKLGSNLTDLATRRHNDLQNIQGGLVNDYYHLKGADYLDLTDGGNSALHYHATDRDLANSTGLAKSIKYNTSPTVTPVVGETYWNAADDTLNIQHSGGVTQQVGLETYYLANNNTGGAIANGVCVGFGGSAGGYVDAMPYIADGTMPSLYSMGITTEAIANGSRGRVTAFGHVRDIDTTGTPYGEVWAVGDILYASPTVAGDLTNIKPTVPNLVVPIAAVLTVDATAGVILVRPTQTLQLYYGSFLCTGNPTAPAANTAYTVSFDTTVASSGIVIGGTTSQLIFSNSGQYEISASFQAIKTSASLGYMWTWVKVNGTDVANSATRTTLSGSNAEAVITRAILLTLQATDYVELCYAADNTASSLQTVASTAFAPQAPAVVVSISQVNQ